LILARNLLFSQDTTHAVVSVSGSEEAICNEIPPPTPDQIYDGINLNLNASGNWSCLAKWTDNSWSLGDMCNDSVPINFSVPVWGNASAIFDPIFDKLYECILTAEPQWEGVKEIKINVYEQDGEIFPHGLIQEIHFNPEIYVDIVLNDAAPNIWFEFGMPGDTVISGNKLLVTNMAEGGVDLYTWVSADDLTSSVLPSKCPYSNVLDTDMYMDYRGRILDNPFGNWTDITNPNSKDGCEFGGTCHGAQGVVDPNDMSANVIENGETLELEFMLNIPVPCVGNFTEGSVNILMRAV